MTLRFNFAAWARVRAPTTKALVNATTRVGLDYLAENYADQEITLCGFSFGARVGMEVGLDDDRVTRLISIGTPVDKYDFSFLTACRKPILFVHGEHDEYGVSKRLRELVSKIKTPATLEVISGAGHFR